MQCAGANAYSPATVSYDRAACGVTAHAGGSAAARRRTAARRRLLRATTRASNGYGHRLSSDGRAAEGSRSCCAGLRGGDRHALRSRLRAAPRGRTASPCLELVITVTIIGIILVGADGRGDQLLQHRRHPVAADRVPRRAVRRGVLAAGRRQHRGASSTYDTHSTLPAPAVRRRSPPCGLPAGTPQS